MAVVGIGGVFFRSHDPKALRAWYEKHLGVVVNFASPWVQAPGPTLFMPFSHGTDKFPADKQWMINFRVTGLAGMITTLREAGIAVTTNPEWDTPQTGQFATVLDPEGNLVELWEPPEE